MRLLLYNIKYGTNTIGKWSWLTFLNSSQRHFRHLTRFIKAVDADIVGLVEVDSGSYRAKGVSQVETLKTLGYIPAIRTKYPSQSLSGTLPIISRQSNAILTRESPVATHYHDLTAGVKRLVIQVDLPRVSVYLVHLALTTNARQRQLTQLARLIAHATTPVIVAGDFNFLTGPWEAELFTKATGLVSANPTLRPTFPSWAPTKTLDYIFVSPQIRIDRLRIPKIIASDHLPLVCDFTILDSPSI